PVPVATYAPRPFPAIIALPRDAEPLEPALRFESQVITFGLVHTDSNQHVNSLVYPRIFEEAALRRLAALGVRTPLLARALEIGYRKPCFAGDRLRLALQAYRLGEHYGAVGMFVGADDVPDETALGRARPHAYIWMQLEP
ncbi:MAG: hotdog domain-containing protein, partial [Deltaproteobacteria bacterium]